MKPRPSGSDTKTGQHMQMMMERDVREGYRVSIAPSPNRIRAIIDGQTIADSRRVLVMQETHAPEVYYFHPDDVRADLLTRTAHLTNCPFKGNASYWTIQTGGTTAVDAAWSYEDAYDEAISVKGYIAFDPAAIDTWLCDDDVVEDQMQTKPTTEENPLMHWLMHDAWKANSTAELLAETARQMNKVGLPLWQMRLFIRTLNPQLFAVFYRWRRGEDNVEEFQATHAGAQSSPYLTSPIAPIIAGEGGVRRRLDGPNPQLDFPVLEDLLAEGATDYVAVPVLFSDGQINVLTMVSDKPGGFSTSQLGFLYESLPILGRLIETYAVRLSALTLLKTYLGKDAGERVLNGRVKRGDGEEVHAVIWFSDLRGSTKMADTMPREDYLAALNQYFDSVAGAILENGGEVLKFIGDAVLAIFPIETRAEAHPAACAKALTAVRQAYQRMIVVNNERAARGEVPLQFGTGLHRGDLTYGNIGTEQRLDFTVIGPAVNEAARIEDLCKPLGMSVVTSAAFANSIPEPLTPLGLQELRGVQIKQAIFTLDWCTRSEGCLEGETMP
jgi:adenylate cyclase